MKNHLQPVTARANSIIKKSKVSPAKQSAQGDYEKGLEQKHIVKSETSAQGDNDNVKRSNRSEVTNVESKSNRRVQKVAVNDSGDKKGSEAGNPSRLRSHPGQHYRRRFTNNAPLFWNPL